MSDPTCPSRSSRPTLERSTPPPTRKRRHQRYRESTPRAPIFSSNSSRARGSVSLYTDLRRERIACDPQAWGELPLPLPRRAWGVADELARERRYERAGAGRASGRARGAVTSPAALPPSADPRPTCRDRADGRDGRRPAARDRRGRVRPGMPQPTAAGARPARDGPRPLARRGMPAARAPGTPAPRAARPRPRHGTRMPGACGHTAVMLDP
jgi:hypothetical protein